MPYASNESLPPSVRPICRPMRRTFIARRLTTPGPRMPAKAGRKEAAHRIAWAAVKRSYVKLGNDWVARR